VSGRRENAAERTERLTRFVRGLAGFPVAVLGDLVADRFVYGDITRISREAPVLILEHRRTVDVPGGGGNAAANLHALGARITPVGVVGQDDAGQRIVDAFRAMDCPTSGLLRLRGWPTPSKSRIVAGGLHTRRQQLVRLDDGAGRGEHPAAVRAALRRHVATLLPRVRALLVSDYGYGSAAPDILAPQIRRARRLGLPVTVDSRTRLDAYSGVTACTPNEEELEAAAGGPADTDRAVAAAARRLLHRIDARMVLATRGPRGMCLVERGRPALLLPAHGSGEVADVAGAGDTVIASFPLALGAGAAPADAALLANCAAGVVVTKAGTASVTTEELVAAIAAELRP